MLSRISLCLCMAIVPISAHADWQYATWGMSPEKVIAASKGVAVRADNPAVARNGERDCSLPPTRRITSCSSFISGSPWGSRSWPGSVLPHSTLQTVRMCVPSCPVSTARRRSPISGRPRPCGGAATRPAISSPFRSTATRVASSITTRYPFPGRPAFRKAEGRWCLPLAKSWQRAGASSICSNRE